MRDRPPAAAPLASLAALARLAGTSASTASRALSGHPSVAAATAQRIRDLARQHGYKPNQMARNLRLGRTQAVGLALPLGHEPGQHLSDPFFLALLGHLADGLTERGYDILLSRIIPAGDDWLDRVIDSGRTDGVILIGQSDQSDTIERAARRGAPVVVWGAHRPDHVQVTVGTDNRRGGALAAHHLIGLGRTRLLFAGKIGLPEFTQRLAGFDEAAAEAGVAAETLDLAMTPDAAHAALGAYLDRAAHVPDAIVAASDVIAMSALRALAERGLRVPADVAVVGYDDVALAAHTTPPLTTIRQDLAAGAAALIERLFRRIAGEPADSLTMPPILVVRGSSVG